MANQRAAIRQSAHEKYQMWKQAQAESHPFLVCALCQNGGVVTIMAGYALCFLCADAIRGTYYVHDMMVIARERARALKLPFGAEEWYKSFENEARREHKREMKRKASEPDAEGVI